MAGAKRIPRWVRVVITIAVALTVVFYLGGGIFFANMIRVDALTPQPPTADNGVYVLAVDGQSITLTSAAEREDTMRPGRAGLDWGQGYGELGEIIAVDGLEVTREFGLVDGDPPQVCVQDLGQCPEVDIEGWTFRTDPSDVGLPFEEVSFPAEIGELGAWKAVAGDGSIWAIHAHGWRAARREAIRSLPTYREAGITSLVIDYRNDEGAPPDPSGLYKFGRTEWQDVEAAVEYALVNGAEKIILVGYSTGAALDLAFLESSDLANRVNGLVFDSPNIDMGETVRYAASKRKIPATSIPVPGSLTAVAMFIADLRWDIGWEDIDHASQHVEVPTLVFHGLNDDRVPIEVSRRFRDASPAEVRLVEIPEAGHVTSWNVDSERYEDEILGFLQELEARS